MWTCCINKGCFNPTSGSGLRWSIYAYGLELAPELVTTTSGIGVGLPGFDLCAPARFARHGPGRHDHAIRLRERRRRHIGAGFDEYLQPRCKSAWSAAYVKLSRCIEAATSPKNRAACAELPVVRDAVPELQEHARGRASARQRSGEPDRRSEGPDAGARARLHRSLHALDPDGRLHQPLATQGRDPEFVRVATSLCEPRRAPRCLLCMIPPHGDACRVLDSD